MEQNFNDYGVKLTKQDRDEVKAVEKLPWTKVIPLPRRWNNGPWKWELLERNGSLGFFKVSTLFGKSSYWEVQRIFVDGSDGFEKIRPSINLSSPYGLNANLGGGDPNIPYDKPVEDPHFIEAKMKAAYVRMCGEDEASKLRQEKKAQEEKEKRAMEQEWLDKVAQIKTQKYDLIFELRSLMNTDPDSLTKNKRALAIASELQVLELTLKYGKL